MPTSSFFRLIVAEFDLETALTEDKEETEEETEEDAEGMAERRSRSLSLYISIIDTRTLRARNVASRKKQVGVS